MGNITPTLNCFKSNQDISDIKDDIRNIRENHLHSINLDIAEIKMDMLEIKTDIKVILMKLDFKKDK